MLYQLPTGKVINISIDDYLKLTELDIQHLISIDAGFYSNSPFLGSSLDNDFDEIIEEDPDSNEDLDLDIDYELFNPYDP
jgi:hypothetical protein